MGRTKAERQIGHSKAAYSRAWIWRLYDVITIVIGIQAILYISLYRVLNSSLTHSINKILSSTTNSSIIMGRFIKRFINQNRANRKKINVFILFSVPVASWRLCSKMKMPFALSLLVLALYLACSFSPGSDCIFSCLSIFSSELCFRECCPCCSNYDFLCSTYLELTPLILQEFISLSLTIPLSYLLFIAGFDKNSFAPIFPNPLSFCHSPSTTFGRLCSSLISFTTFVATLGFSPLFLAASPHIMYARLFALTFEPIFHSVCLFSTFHVKGLPLFSLW